MNTQGKFLSHQQLNEKFPGCMSWLEYNSLIAAIPQKWKTNVVIDYSNLITLYEKLENTTGIASKAYNIALSMKNKTAPIVKVISKLNDKYEVTEQEARKAFVNIVKTTNITKYRDFQYRLLCNAIHANDRLFYWKIVDSQKCEWCGVEKQTTMHMLYECPFIQRIWSDMEQFMENEFEMEEKPKLGTKEILLNQAIQNPGHLVNFFVLMIKQYLYACKCQSVIPETNEIITKFKKLYVIEKYNATGTQAYNKHVKKWLPYSKIQIGVENTQQNVNNEYEIEYINSIDL